MKAKINPLTIIPYNLLLFYHLQLLILILVVCKFVVLYEILKDE